MIVAVAIGVWVALCASVPLHPLVALLGGIVVGFVAGTVQARMETR